MEEIRQIALAYYVNLQPNQKNAISKLFRDMDGDGNGSITFTEYMTFFKFQAEEIASAAWLFKEFDSDGNGTLDFEEVICFSYAIATRRMLYCDGCRKFLKGAYFTCVQCFSQTQSFDLCCTCFRTANFKHHPGADFYDNYALLRSGIITSSSSPAPTTSSSSPAPTKSSSKGSKSNEVLQRLDTGLDVFVTGMNIVQAAAQFGCSIM